MSASEFTEYVGYSRQGLYSILEHHRHPVNKKRFKAMLSMLAKKNSEMADQEFAELKQRSESRLRMLDAMEKEVVYGGEQNADGV